MNPNRMFPGASQRHLLAVCLASVLAGAGASVQAGEREDSVVRARGHITAFAQRTLHGADHGYEARDVVLDADGASHVRFDRFIRGMRVIGGDLVVHSGRNGAFTGASLTLTRAPAVDDRAAVSAASATRAALAGRASHRAEGAPERVVYARTEPARLAWDVVLHGEQADGTPSELHVIVDARTGQVLETWDDIHTAPASGTGRGFFNGTVALTTDKPTSKATYYLRDPSRGNQYTVNMANRTSGGSVFTDADNGWGDSTLANVQTVGVDAQYGTAVTWDYFKLVHGRNGIANDGKGAYNRVHYGRRYNNAFWSDSCFCMTYGDGDGTTFNPFDSLDVAGHEMSHGLTSRTARLVYSGESGGLNEATSDIFGTMVEFYANNPNDTPDYLIGEKLYKSGASALRAMYRPSLDGASADCWYPTLGSLDVHYSSGVANHFFYLLAEGSAPAGMPASPVCQAGDTRVATGTGTGSLVGIGRDAAAKIWYRALTVYMTSSTNHAAARLATIQAATDLFGAGSPQSNAVAAAWSAVGVL